MKKNPLLGALPIIAIMLGQKLGVQVVVGGDRAATNGKVIYLPSLPPDGDPTLAVLANGFIDHEAAHIRYTDFQVDKPAGLTGLLTNILEDVRIERLLGEHFPGSGHNLAALVEVLAAQESFVPQPEAPIAAQVGAALSMILRSRLLSQTALATAAATLESRLDGLLPQGVVIKLMALAFEVRNTASTAEVVDLARRIVALLEDEAKPPADQPDSRSGSSSRQQAGAASESESDGGSDPRPPAGAGSGDGSNSSSRQQAGAGDNTGAAAGSDPRPPAGAGSGDGSNSSSRQQAGDEAGAARRSALSALLAATATDADASAVAALAGALLEQAQREARLGESSVVVAHMDEAPANIDPQGTVARARAATAPLRRRLGALVEARQRDTAWRSRRGRRLDTDDLYRPAVGQPIRFVRKDERPAPHTAVALLLDRSGSMRGRERLATHAVLSILLALESLSGVSTWAAAFPGMNNVRVTPLKRFEERAQRIAGRFSALEAHGSTPLANALWRAGGDLAQRLEPRRLIVVATDGEPDDSHAARAIIARCRASGIEVLGLGIGQSLREIQTLFGADQATAIDTMAELAPALFKVLEQHLAPA